MSTFADRELEWNVTDKCGVTMNRSVEGEIVADLMRGRPGVVVTEYPAMIRIDGTDKLVFDTNEISEALGKEYDPYTFQIEMSTHYGRMVMLDDAVVLYADFDATKEYID
ncbi:MAG: MmoB/DmpM family protein [Anaerolineae bacterium]|mgnify:CR=1 FL=1|nr:MmoB/DmpM family protein [Anaerolineae bacterium]MCB0181252.1 MmoB/DmpM family protein [Anaerolineae bacterium]MCB0224966.1 MmoB/DmpM family protein [Anaerolineae bacterium]